MDLEYDEKFEEMKKYIPFLENMIKRLEATSQSSSNPRQAQLDKIRSLRDLLLNKKKRMKMENLLKCEQVLVNLYAKVEQRETKSAAPKAPDPGFSIDPPTPQEKSDLEAVRNKLKTVVKREKEEVQDTLPEILRVGEFEEVHTAGSKEPALFQRRPNKASLSPTHPTPIKTNDEKVSSSSSSKRNYTRVLVSPESNSRRWSTSETSPEEKLFSRRSPRRSPRRHSPAYHKRERKKSSKESSTPRKAKDLNITLNVPEDSLSSLNTKDIFTRIINCRDSDVDIDTLRELRKQILTELQKTGAREDISDLILKSYKKKTKNLPKKKEEVEEGELSDSESEVIENIYGNLVLKDQNDVKSGSDKSKPRKIQICLVINSDKENPDANAEMPNNPDFLELEMYDKESKKDKEVNSGKEDSTANSVNEGMKKSSVKEDDKTKISEDNLKSPSTKDNMNLGLVQEEIKNNSKKEQIKLDSIKDAIKNKTITGQSNDTTNKNNKLEVIIIDDENKSTNSHVEQSTDQKSKTIVSQDRRNQNLDKEIVTQELVQNKANFYKPLTSETKIDAICSKASTTAVNNVDGIVEELQRMESSVEIPLLNEPTVHSRPTDNTVSEIDILQALKNEILSESITLPGSEATPLLHQPKLTKVASSKEMLPKKRISIEKYKEKVVSTPKLHLDENISAKDDHARKTSLKLTEKECERFNIPTLSYDEDSSSGDGDILTAKVYSGLAPKSPDHDDSGNVGSVVPPVIIPADPVKVVPVQKTDVDMRNLPMKNTPPVTVPLNHDLSIDKKSSDAKLDHSKTLNKPLIDPRKRRDSNRPNTQYSSPHAGNKDRTSRSIYPNKTPSPAHSTILTPNARSYEMTPSHQQSFETDQSANKHVYVPTFSSFDSRDRETSVARDSRWDKVEQPFARKSGFDDHGDASWSSSDVSQSTRYNDSFTGDKNKVQRNDRYSVDNRDSYLSKRVESSQSSTASFGRSELPMTSPSYGRLDKPMTPLHAFGRSDCPSTPSHPFGRLDCPSTPSHPFGRLDCPSTPSHPFGRSECPSTPSHPFGRSECPPTPSHSFGRNECPSTPIHPFGRSECPGTPTHSFGAGECLPTTNLFGRIDCQKTPSHTFPQNQRPLTPNHSFGRSETTTNQFMRSDLNTQKYTKDPRLRKEYDANSQYEDRDRASNKDREYYRENSYNPQKSFSGSDKYHAQERERGRNSKYRYFAPDQSSRQLQNEQPRSEHRPNVSMSKGSDNDPRQRGRFNIDTSRDDFGYRHGNQREISIGRDARERSVSRNVRTDDTFRRNLSRAQSVGRNFSIDLEKKSLSVQAQSSRSFSIDTSINATFQKFLERGQGIQLFEQNFDDRRRRAASVGRSLVQTPNERSYAEDAMPSTDVSKKRDHFRRASSVGRDVAHCAVEKRSFQEIKADFKTYRFPANAFCKFDTGKIRNIDTKPKTSTDHNRSRKDIHDKQKEEKRVYDSIKLSNTKYSPRKNNRDPRMRRDYEAKTKYDYRGDPRSRKSGIVYSNDNIVKGSILTSGYGVKNYKIPKIKRAEEPEVELPTKDELPGIVNEKDKTKEKNNQKLKETMIDKETKDRKEIKRKKSEGASAEKVKDATKDIKSKVILKGKQDKDIVSDTDTDGDKKQIQNDNVSDENVEKRLTRSSRRNIEAKTVSESLTRSKKNKKLVINDSDSETENDESVNNINDTCGLETSTPVSPVKVNEKNVFMKPSAVDIDTNFGLEELEMFSDNVVSDPVIDNINALIADLDNDLDTSKNETGNNFTKEITLENMMQNISCPNEDSASKSAEEFSKAFQPVKNIKSNSQECSLTDINNVEKNIESADLGDNKCTEHSDDSQELKSDMSQNKSNEIENTAGPGKNASENVIVPAIASNLDKSPSLEKLNEDIVSTSESDKDVNSAKMEEQDVDGCSTPDSTINTDDILDKPTKESVADSTNEMHNETNVTSTDSTEPKPSSSHPEGTDLESIGSLLSILQNKSKIKDLLSMLCDQTGNNEKIKKKLEKLSEIVSDDENDSQPNELPASIGEASNSTISDKTEIEKIDVEVTKEDEKQFVYGEGDEKNTIDFDAEKTEEANVVDKQPVAENKPKKKTPVRKGKFARKHKGKFAKGGAAPAMKRVTRATATTDETKPKSKKPPRELMKLHEDIKEMFIKEDILNSTTGIRMCRLAKLVDEKTTQKEDIVLPEAEPIVVLEKFKSTADKSQEHPEKTRKKPGPKPKQKISAESSPEIEKVVKKKPGPKSKTRTGKESDPYDFETESIGDNNTEKVSDGESETSSDSELCSLASSKSISGSSEILTDIKKKPKRKRPRRGWQDGVIKPKHKKKKVETKLEQLSDGVRTIASSAKPSFIPDLNCFTDRSYSFRKNELSYSCRLCGYAGNDIVHHYKNEHPHVEIPLSRIPPQVAKEAIEQCKDLDFQVVGKIPSSKYVCIFCFKEFANNNSVLETFFWHVVSMHTGEYKYDCSICVNESRCISSLDIPPPPPDPVGQLIGYICKKCNFIQLSLENLKTHVIERHNDEQTAVYTINLAVLTKKDFKEFLNRCNTAQNNKLQVTKQLQEKSFKKIDASDSELTQSKPVPALTNIQSKITFEADDTSEISLTRGGERGPSTPKIKMEHVNTHNTDENFHSEPQSDDADINRPSDVDGSQKNQSFSLDLGAPQTGLSSIVDDESSQASDDIVDYPHFKINITASGAKEYICCINGKDNHFKTTLLISMKKHVQSKHSENWDGYCFVCKVIVTPQGAHPFKECFQHYLDKHMDNFPVYQEVATKLVLPSSPAQSKSYINVRPLSQLISTEISESPTFPVIQNVISLSPQQVEVPQPSPSYPAVIQEKRPSEVPFRYEEVQADVMSKKHRVVLETMMARDKLINVYKCAGRFCSFTSDAAEDSLLHASTHQRIGGIDALNCCYCDFDAMGNAIDLVMHVFRVHGHCQFACGQCFYRAAASQSVGVHMSRVHGVNLAAVTVLRATSAKPNTVTEQMMTREQAVPYYVCKHAESDDVCKFRTYTPDKFCDHLQQRHADATAHPCYLCTTETPTASELVQHMKSHGLKLYQCTWCVFGANNETELLAHYSASHPTKQPQTYVRIITNKEGSNELRVLPLAFLNKLKVAIEDVSPTVAKENPAREAERSLDLEKLIGLTMISEPMQLNETVLQDNLDTADTSELSDQTLHSVTQLIHLQLDSNLPITTTDIATMLPENKQTVTGNIDTTVTAEPIPIATVDPLPITAPVSVKTEPLDKAKPKASDVVVLDSDEDDTTPTPTKTNESIETVDLSDEEHSVRFQKNTIIERKGLVDKQSMCPKCLQVCKSLNGLKKHLFYCYRNKDESCKCPHCQFYAKDRDAILMHYITSHNEKDNYLCGICKIAFMSVNLVKKHMKNAHKEKDLIVSSTTSKGSISYTVNVAPQEKNKSSAEKNKSSAEKNKSSATETAKRRFWPHEINQLPINPILDQLVFCEQCGFSTKVRLNMFRHLQQHAQQQPVAQSAPVNPVPHLETNEKHFDKMVNLASSSASGLKKMPEPPPADKPANFVGIRMPAEAAARYPKQISARERNTCGAIGCTYISVDEAMLKRHWEALHSGNTNFRCVHCPQTQTLDTSRPLTAPRVLSHLRMHDGTLYACSKCHYYHYKREFLERHLTETHQNTGELLIVREESKAVKVVAQQPAAAPAAPTMDLKPWQCGLCQFKSMLRPEVVDHCFNVHQSKMQFRCAHCPYRASAIENVNNHLAHSHANEAEEVIYYYYREGSLPDEDGVPKWMKQRQQMGSNVPEIKTEEQVSLVQSPVKSPVTVDLNLVKTEVVNEGSTEAEDTVELLCKKYGEFCEPNGIKYKCPLCKVMMADTREAMQSHLYEELKYRKWGCGLCTYKAFHTKGLSEHMTSEHRRQSEHIELPTNTSIEMWVTAQLDHQAAIIDKHKTNLAKQKIIVERANPGPSSAPTPVIEPQKNFTVTDLENAFGSFGASKNMMYCCPKCGNLQKDEALMRDHLETELNKIRWGCNNCPEKFQTYHEAQFHCKTHDVPSTPKEAIRAPAMRAAWVTAILQIQRNQLQAVPTTSYVSESCPPESNVEPENSLLVIRYEEPVPSPEQITRRKRPAADSDDERLVIDESLAKKPNMRATSCNLRACLYCDFKTKHHNAWREHILKHFNLKPYTCYYCDFSSYRQSVLNHTERMHANKPVLLKMTEMPSEGPVIYSPKKRIQDDDPSKLICLICEKAFSETDADTHFHDKIKPEFGKKGDVVVKCCICLHLSLDVKSLHDHHIKAHPNQQVNYALFKLHFDSREILSCDHCNAGFKYVRDLKTHHNAVHATHPLSYTTTPYIPQSAESASRQITQSVTKRSARKSTTKLPGNKSVAKKSTTKLPYSDSSSSDDEEYSYYNTRPEPLEKYANVTTLMSFCNRMVPFTLKKLSEIINIEPKVIVEDIKNKPQ